MSSEPHLTVRKCTFREVLSAASRVTPQTYVSVGKFIFRVVWQYANRGAIHLV